MTSFKEIISNKRQTKKVKFMGEDVTISKLTVAQVQRVQELARDLNEDSEDTESGIAVLKMIISTAVEGAEDLSDEDFECIPLDDLQTLSEEVMKFSGMSGKRK